MDFQFTCQEIAFYNTLYKNQRVTLLGYGYLTWKNIGSWE